jgi:hypothetical protein
MRKRYGVVQQRRAYILVYLEVLCYFPPFVLLKGFSDFGWNSGWNTKFSTMYAKFIV